MSTSWKSLAAGFALGVVSTGIFALGGHVGHAVGVLLWVFTVLYIGYVRHEAAG